jgi:hypothetical protein
VWSIWPCSIWAAIPYPFQTRLSFAGEAVRNRHWFIIPCESEYPRTSLTRVAVGFASMPSSATREAAGPSSRFACTIEVVVSGQIVVQRESTNASSTVLPL